MDDEVDRPEPPSAKAVMALLREARSLSRRADKLSGTAAAVDDPTTEQLAAEACTSMEQLVHHLRRCRWVGARVQAVSARVSDDAVQGAGLQAEPAPLQ